MARLPRNLRPTPILTRSRVVLEIASELVADRDQPYNQAKVMLRAQGAADWPLALFGSSTVEGVDAVVKGEAALAIITPAAALGFAYRGEPPFTAPQPVRSIGVIPTSDQIVFAVSRDFGENDGSARLASTSRFSSRRISSRARAHFASRRSSDFPPSLAMSRCSSTIDFDSPANAASSTEGSSS